MGLDLNAVRQLAKYRHNGDGFAYLAEKQYDAGDISEALRLVNDGLVFDPNSNGLNRLYVTLMRLKFP